MKKLGVVIGRFQPLHDGHKKLIDSALKECEEVIVLIGSAHEARSIKNPWTYEERSMMVTDNFKVKTFPVRDYLYKESEWYKDVRNLIKAEKRGRKVCLFGYEKDPSSSYLKHFPDYEYIPVAPHKPEGVVLNATDIREDWFELSLTDPCNLMSSQEWKNLVDEYFFIQRYKEAWERAPFPPTFNCSDAIVIQSGHVLLIKRKFAPGKGLMAIPGGFIDPTETSLDCALRELREETGLKIPEKVLRGSLFCEKVFDHPARSERGRTFSHAFGFHLDDSQPLPRVSGGDDAEKARWYPIEQVKSNEFSSMMYEDHASILDYFFSRL